MPLKQKVEKAKLEERQRQNAKSLLAGKTLQKSHLHFGCQLSVECNRVVVQLTVEWGRVVQSGAEHINQRHSAALKW